MFAETTAQIARIEADPKITDRLSALRALRAIGLGDFGWFMISLPNPAFPRLSSMLPSMASADVQRLWTGRDGVSLLEQTDAFVRIVALNFRQLTGHLLNGASILDFGCGYGRIARPMYWFTDPGRVIGVDPWDRSIQICHECGLTEGFYQSDYLPRSLPVADRRFDLIYAFSVFTHLSERAAKRALSTLRIYAGAEAVLALTIRPVEYWRFANADNAAAMMAAHDARGFAFSPHPREAVDGEITYGDTSMSLTWLGANAPAWRIAATDRSVADPYQTCVFLRPA